MTEGEIIQIHFENERRARDLLARTQSEASIYAQRLAWLSQRLAQLARESAPGLAKLNEIGQAIDSDTLRAITTYPSREAVDGVLTGMITAAMTIEAARSELRKLGLNTET